MAIVIANWKMHFTLQEAEEFCSNLINSHNNNSLIIAPPTPYLAYLASLFPTITFASQNVSIYNNFGSYTGEYSAHILKSCKVQYVIIGHAERRELFSEHKNILKQQIHNLFEANLIPIICIGETFAVRQNNLYKQFIISQLSNIIMQNKKVIIAYEPIWSIGSGLNPTMQELEEIFIIIKDYLIDASLVNKVELVYGGSVTPENIQQILTVKGVDGVLVGSAALSYRSLKQIIEEKY